MKSKKYTINRKTRKQYIQDNTSRRNSQNAVTPYYILRSYEDWK